MTGFIKPQIFVSKCLGFASCRWNGAVIPDKFIEKLKGHVSFITACPEVEIGLGVPRDPIRIILSDKGYSLKQFNTGKDVTDTMNAFSEDFLNDLSGIDGFILKDRSPSCGIKGVKVYPGMEKTGPIEKTSGFFAEKVLDKFPYLAVETEGRLSNFKLREHFLTRIFIQSRFRGINNIGKISGLVSFHTDNKLLLMAYNQKQLRILGRIVADHKNKDTANIFSEYQDHLALALARPPRYTSAINAMMHALGYFSNKLSKDEKHLFLNYLEEYRREQVPLSVPLSLLSSYIVRFKEEYLQRQTFFVSYPKELTLVTDSGKGRKKQ